MLVQWVKMSEVVLQVLLILAYLAIGLLAVTFPIYAISVTFLPREKWESERERKKRIEKLQTKISELTAELKGGQQAGERVTQIKQEIERYETELRATELRFRCLTAKGAVGIPVSYLAFALLMVGFGLYCFNQESWYGVVAFGFLSSLFSALAVHRLYKTITAVEYAVLRPARSVDFIVGFNPGYDLSKQVKIGEKVELWISIEPEEDIEECMMFIDVPSEIEVTSISKEPDIVITKHQTVTTIGVSFGFRPKDKGCGYRDFVNARKIGKYMIFIWITGKGIHRYEKELTLEVVE